MEETGRGPLALLVTLTVGALAGACHRLLGMTSGAQYMGYYVATLFVPLLIS
jgi:hypothetical protein